MLIFHVYLFEIFRKTVKNLRHYRSHRTKVELRNLQTPLESQNESLNTKNCRKYRSHRNNDEVPKLSDTIGVTEPTLNYETIVTIKQCLTTKNFKHCRSNRSKAGLRKTSGTTGVTEPTLNSGYVLGTVILFLNYTLLIDTVTVPATIFL